MRGRSHHYAVGGGGVERWGALRIASLDLLLLNLLLLNLLLLDLLLLNLLLLALKEAIAFFSGDLLLLNMDCR